MLTKCQRLVSGRVSDIVSAQFAIEASDTSPPSRTLILCKTAGSRCRSAISATIECPASPQLLALLNGVTARIMERAPSFLGALCGGTVCARYGEIYHIIPVVRSG